MTPVAEMIRAFWRQKMLLVGVVVLVTGLTAFAAYQIEPRYRATARILVSTEIPGIVPERQPLDTARALIGGGDRAAVYSEIEVMQSDRLIEKMVERFELDKDIEFNPALQPGMLAPIRDFAPVKWLIESISPLRGTQTPEEREARELKRIVDSVRNRMTIRPPGLANIVSVQFETHSPVKSARLANGFVHVYNEDLLTRAAEDAAETRLWLESRIRELDADVEAAERRVADFLAERRLDDEGKSITVERQFADLSRQLSTVRSAAAEKRVRLRQLRSLLESGKGLDSTTEVQESRTIQRLRDQEATLVRRAAELNTRFGERHPTMVNLRAEIKNTRSQIAEEQVRIVDALANEVRVAEAGVATLQRQLQELDEQRASSNSDRVELQQLQREALANRKLYEMFLARSKEIEQTASLKRRPVQVISTAKPPTQPSYPRKGLIIGFGFFFSIGLGIFIVLLIERLDGGFRSVAQLERIMREPALGVVPRVSGAERRKGPAHDLIFLDSNSSYVEAIRSLRTSLMVANETAPKVVLIASSQTGDGKTSLALSLARLSAIAALDGRVLLIDGDLRKPSIAVAVGARPDKGLINVFSGEATFDEVVVTDERSGLHILPSIPGTPNPPELLNSSHMRDLLAELRNKYEMIIIDSPPLDSVSDARVLAHYADATVFVVRWETTKQHAAIEAMKQLATAGARVAGVVLQQVNIRKTESYGYREAAAA